MLKREGTNQAERTLKALLPEAAPIDQHEIADWLVFVQKLSKYLKYFRTDNQYHNEDWQSFFEKDETAILAVVAVEEVDNYKNRVQELFTKGIQAELNNNPVDETKLKQAFTNLFSLAANLAWGLNQLQQRLPETVALKQTIQNLIKTRLAIELHKLQVYFAAASPDLIDETNLLPGTLLGQPIAAASEVFTRPFSSFWVDTTSIDPNIFGPTTPGELARKIYFASNHNSFTNIFDQFLRALATINTEAKKQLAETLQRNTHEPHQALLLAFLKLLLYARDQLNTITGQHLDFYYQQILQLAPKPAQPSQVHLIFELATHLENLILPKGTGLNAGKDSKGQEVIFALNADFALNKTQITALKSFYHATQLDENLKKNAGTIFKGHLFAAPVANSEDGLGAELTSPDKQWHPFAHKIFENGKLRDIAIPAAQAGFAVASPYLYLT